MTKLRNIYITFVLVIHSFYLIGVNGEEFDVFETESDKSNVEVLPNYKYWHINQTLMLINGIKKRNNFEYYKRHHSYECCPSFEEIIQPKGGVSRNGRIFELYTDNNATQTFYQISCIEGVKGSECRYISSKFRRKSHCVQMYTYTYAIVREFGSSNMLPWRLDYIRIRSGCSCQIKGYN